MGEIWRALEVATGRHVIIKCLPDMLASDPDLSRRFDEEVKILATLDHPGIVRLYYAFPKDGRIFIVMEYIQGRSLAEVLRDGKEISLVQCLEWFRQVAKALIQVHNRDVYHRDIKPSNIMVDSVASARLIDFGVAHRLGRVVTSISQAGIPLTPDYAAPEQFLQVSADDRSDIFSLALTMQHVVTGIPPGARRRDGGLDVHIPRSWPPRVAAIFRRCLEVDPNRRYQNASILLGDLSRALDERRWVLSRRQLLLAGAAVVLLAVVSGGVWVARRAHRSAVSMVRVSGGAFVSGLEKERIPEGFREAGDWVMITRGRPHTRSAGPFRMDLCEVTNAEYARFVRATGHRAPKYWRGLEPPLEMNDHPVTNVSQGDAAAYARWVGKRLPSADEWEKAARGDTHRVYPWGDVFSSDKANTLEAGIGKTTPVRAFPQDLSPYGVIGLGGNVTEWTSTVSDDPEYEGCFVVCGGSYLELGEMVSLASFRRLLPEDALGTDVGFRCVKETR